MIYEAVGTEDPIQQGDLFAHIPRVDFSLGALSLVEDDNDELRQTNWHDVDPGSEVAAVLSIKSVSAIVVTQNCDARRGHYICLSQIDPFLTATGESPPKNADKWQSLIMKYSRTNPRFFYLPADAAVGFAEPMAADFRVILRVPREDLEQLRPTGRIGRLNTTALDHFREKLAYFFRRHAFDEWYPLSREEFQAYADRCGEPVEPFPWQR